LIDVCVLAKPIKKFVFYDEPEEKNNACKDNKPESMPASIPGNLSREMKLAKNPPMIIPTTESTMASHQAT